jgi:hypothetical protein
LVITTVTVKILKLSHHTYRLIFAITIGIGHVATHLNHIHEAIFVPCDRYGVFNQWLGSDQLNLEIGSKRKTRQGLLGR